MPYSLLIADDEYFIRKRLVKIIQESTIDITIDAEAENGQEVIDYLLEHPVDILLLDIRMPRLTGLEVLKIVQKNYPLTKVIILSSYREFEYAKNALQAGAFDYLLKPIQHEELFHTLTQCMESIRESRTIQKKLIRASQIEKFQAVQKYQNKEISRAELNALSPAFKQVQWSFYLGFYTADANSCIIEILFLLTELKYHFVYQQETDHTFILHFFINENEEMQQICQNVIPIVSARVKQLFWKVSDLYEFDSDTPEHYHQLKDLLLLRFFPDLTETALSSACDFSLLKIRQNLVACLNARDTDSLQTYLQKLFDSAVQTALPKNLVLLTREIILTLQLYAPTVPGIIELSVNALDEDYSLPELKEHIFSFCLMAIKPTDASPSELYLTKKITDYIQKNYMNRLSVAEIADTLKMNSSYLSNIFRKTNQLSINQYITKIRMENAYNLLQTHQYKIQEVAEMVGYPDIFYFSKRFKKYFGQSPKNIPYQENADK